MTSSTRRCSTSRMNRGFLILFLVLADSFTRFDALTLIQFEAFDRAYSSSSVDTLLTIVRILINRINIRVTVVSDSRAASLGENVIRALHGEQRTTLSVFESGPEHRENITFSKVNVLCFHKDDNFVSFATYRREQWPPDAYNIILVEQEPQPERTRKSLSSSIVVMSHTVLVYESRVFRIQPRCVSKLNVSVKTTRIRDIFGMRNFNGRVLRVTQFQRVPEVMPTKSGFMGSSYNMLLTLAQHLNFTPLISDSSDGERFGDFVNGSFTGALGDIVYNRTDMVMNGFFLQEPLSDLYWYTVPVNFEQICLVVPKAKRIPKYLTPFRCLSFEVWILLDLTFLTVCCVYHVIARLSYKHMNFKNMNDPITATLSATINVPLSVSHYKYPTLRVLLIVYLSFMYVVVSTFKASLVTLLTVPVYGDDIDSLEELQRSGRLTELITFSKAVAKSFKRAELADDATLSTLHGRIKYVNPELAQNYDDNDDGVYLARFLYTQRKYVNDFQIRRKDNKTFTLHRVRKCLMRYYVVYLLPRNFPFVEEINTMLGRITESGLSAKWDTDVLFYALTEKSFPFKQLPASKQNTIQFQSQLERFSIEHLQVAFYILFAGWSLSVSAFLGELALVYKLKTNAGKDRRILARKKIG